ASACAVTSASRTHGPPAPRGVSLGRGGDTTPPPPPGGGGGRVGEGAPAMPQAPAPPPRHSAIRGEGVAAALPRLKLAPVVEELARMTREAYDGFRHPAVTPLVQLAPNTFVLELFHGPTLAFKDLAMQLVARLM